jgi:hypothetical protein
MFMVGVVGAPVMATVLLTGAGVEQKFVKGAPGLDVAQVYTLL